MGYALNSEGSQPQPIAPGSYGSAPSPHDWALVRYIPWMLARSLPLVAWFSLLGGTLAGQEERPDTMRETFDGIGASAKDAGP